MADKESAREENKRKRSSSVAPVWVLGAAGACADQVSQSELCSGLSGVPDGCDCCGGAAVHHRQRACGVSAHR